MQALVPAAQPFEPLPVQALELAAQHFTPLVPATANRLYASRASPMLHVNPVAPGEAAPPPWNDIIIIDGDKHEAAPRLPTLF